MKAVFSLLGLLVVVAVVALMAKQQLQAVSPAPAGQAGPATATPAPREAVERAAADVQRALEQGAAARASEADR